MENNELLKRGEDLARRCENKGCLTSTGFLTPAEQYALAHDAELRFSRMVFRGGHEDFERGMAFFLPDYMEEAELIESEHIRAIKLTAAFGEPAHRDYMGAVLGMGVNREWVGDIIVDGCTAYVLCQPSVLRHLLSIDKVGRCGVRVEEIALSELPHKARQIAAGNVSLNYTECLKGDRSVKEGDIVSLRGAGKGRLKELGGSSKKGRLFVTAEIFK